MRKIKMSNYLRYASSPWNLMFIIIVSLSGSQNILIRVHKGNVNKYGSL